MAPARPRVSFGAPEEDRMSIAASEERLSPGDVEDSAEQPPLQWLMGDADKVHFLHTPISQTGLFGDTLEDFAQQFSAVQKQTEAIKHNLPRHESTKPPGARFPSVLTTTCLDTWPRGTPARRNT
ncbi:hypothetical protein M9458_017121, partial [Cirrhinus mrigala]